MDARERVGGRTLSSDGWIDLGATWFWDGEAAVAETIRSLDLATYPQVISGDALFQQPSGEVVRLAGNPIDVPAWRIAGGTQSLALALAHQLPDDALKTGAPVQSVIFDPAGPVLVQTASTTITGQAVMLAVPPALAMEAIAFSPELPSVLAGAARAVQTWMSDTIKAVARFTEPFWRVDGLAGAAISHAGPFCEFHDHSGPELDQVALFGFASAAQLSGASESEIASCFQDQLVQLWGPAAHNTSEIQVVNWNREPFTATAVDSAMFRYYGNPVLRVPHLDGRLMFASTETADAFAGHIEGAVLAGRRAAAQARDRVTMSGRTRVTDTR